VFFTVAGMYAFTKYWKRSKSRWALLTGTALGMATMAHYNGGFGVLAFFILFLMIRSSEGSIDCKGLGFFILGVSVSCLPYLVYVMRDYNTGFHNFRTQLSVVGRVGRFNTFLDYLRTELGRYYEFFHDYRFVPGGHLFAKVVSYAILTFALVWRDKLYRLIMIAVIVHLALLLYPSPNKTSVYLGVVLPFMSILGGLSITDLDETLARRPSKFSMPYRVFAALLVLTFLGIGGKIWISSYEKYRECDFYDTIAQIRRTLPASVSSIMGRYTFWIGLYDYDYYRWGFRDFEDIEEVEPQVFIHNDYRMSQPDLSAFRTTLDEYFRERAELIGEVQGHPQHICRIGDLRIYRVHWGP
jgi:hypothetical protein